MKNPGRHVSMDAPFRDGESHNLYDVIESKAAASPDQGVMDDSLVTDMDQALSTLPTREGDVLRLYYGLGDQQPMSLVEIGDTFDITRERARQIKEKAIKKLRQPAKNGVLRTHL